MLSFVFLLLPISAPDPWSVGAYVLLVLVLLWAVQRRAYGLPRPRSTQQSGNQAGSANDAGSVYVLSNPEHPGLVKIGYTTRNAADRARELSASTGVPRPFEVEYEAAVPNPQAVETAVHQALDHRMVNPDREFFEVSVRTAIRTIRRITDANARGQEGGLPSLIPRWMRSWLETGLGGLLLAGSCFSAAALMISSTPIDNNPASWTHTHSESAFSPGPAPALLQYVPEGLAEPIAIVGHAVGPGLLGYSGLLLVGMVGLWGYALVRHRSLRPLRRPTILAVTVVVAVAGIFGGMVQHAQAAPSLWTGGTGEADTLRSWCGAVGTAAADGLHPHLGTTGTLLLFTVLLIGSLLFGVWWALSPTEFGSS